MKRASAFRPCLEPLEDRFLLAACHVGRLGDLNSGNDFGNGHARGSLRYCLNLANNNPGPDTIDFNVTGTIQLTNELPTLTSEITVIGPGADLLTVRGKGRAAGGDRILQIDPGATVTISGLTISKGYVEDVLGLIWNNGGTLILKDCTIADHYVFAGTNGYGSAITNFGMLTISGCTISGNSGDSHAEKILGTGIYNGTNGVLLIENSTISGNKLFVGDGSAIYNRGSLDIRFSTITANTGGTPPSAIYNEASAPPISLYNTIVAGNSGGADIVGSYTGSANLIGGDPKLGVLQYNGGHTKTHKVLQMSPALNAGDNTGAPEFDQRGPGFPRIVNGTVDIGAFEVQSSPIPSPPAVSPRHETDFLTLLLATADLDAVD